MGDIAVTFITVLLGVIVGIALYNWIRAELDEREWRRILEDKELVTYRLTRSDSKDSDRE